MSDVNVIVQAAPIDISVEAAPVGINVQAAPIEINVEAAPMAVVTQDAPIKIVISGAQGPAGTSDLETTWFYLANSWTTEPVLHVTTPVLGGQVFTYTYGATTYYRHVPDPYDSTEDTFYSGYALGVLSTPIATKGIAI